MSGTGTPPKGITDVNFTGAKLGEQVPRKRKLHFGMFTEAELKEQPEDLIKSLNTIESIRRGGEVVELTFKEDPKQNSYNGVWKPKRGLVPDNMKKAIARKNDLVASILQARANFGSAFGRELQDRFSTGFRIEPRPGIMQKLDEKQREELLDEIDDVSNRLATCGDTEGFSVDRQESMSKFMYQSFRNGVLFGAFATEVIWKDSPGSEEPVFHAFRAVDSGTIHYAHPKVERQDPQIREKALDLLQQFFNEKLNRENVKEYKYAYYQVINNTPVQGFTDKEMFYWPLYPCTDIELGGYPVTPIDTALTAIVTHLNITSHNRLYFQNGRAARGMVIIQSEDEDASFVEVIRQHFAASVTGVDKAFRVPVFGIGTEDKITWQPMESQGGRDMEFQYLSDQNSRIILSAFQMSPEELPGYQHLSRGSNNQSLTESNNEYKLEAARDIGIRPILANFQDFLNTRILPLFSKRVAKYCVLKLYGLDADTPEREASRIAADAPLHGTQDDIQERVEKEPYGKEWGGEFPLSPSYQQILDRYFTVGEIKEHFFGRKDASKDPSLQYYRDEYWFNYQQMLMQQQQMQMQAKQMEMQQQAMAQQPGAQGGQPGQEGAGDDGAQQDDGEQLPDVASGAEQASASLSKAEAQLPVNQRRVLAQHNVLLKTVMKTWKREAKEVNRVARQTKRRQEG